MSKVVVTGGNGFLGSHLVAKLRNDGRKIVVSHYDLRDYQYALWLIKGADVVYHLAAVVGGEKYLHGTNQAELSALQSNLMIDANVFRACRKTRIKKLIYTSSCAVYPLERQNSLGAVFNEEDAKSFDPDGGYGWAKVIGEIQLSCMGNVGIIRPFNIYGIGEPTDNHSHVVLDLIRKAIKYPKVEFEVWGGKQTRDFVYVDDCVDALIELENRLNGSPITVNIGSGQATSIKELAEKIIHISGKDIKPKYKKIQIRQFSRTADITKAKTLLDWQPKISLDEGLRKTYAWFENHSFNLH